MRSPRYFFALFGDPEAPSKDLVESGVYHPDTKYSITPEPGDIILMYCTGSYPGREMQVPGVGIVIGKNTTQLLYRFIPLQNVLYKDDLERGFVEKELKKLSNIRFSSHWLFEISKESFNEIFKNSKFNWP